MMPPSPELTPGAECPRAAIVRKTAAYLQDVLRANPGVGGLEAYVTGERDRAHDKIAACGACTIRGIVLPPEEQADPCYNETAILWDAEVRRKVAVLLGSRPSKPPGPGSASASPPPITAQQCFTALEGSRFLRGVDQYRTHLLRAKRALMESNKPIPLPLDQKITRMRTFHEGLLGSFKQCTVCFFGSQGLIRPASRGKPCGAPPEALNYLQLVRDPYILPIEYLPRQPDPDPEPPN